MNIIATWNSRGLRGSTLEELINYSNEVYREKNLALIQKVPTPIKPIKIDKENRHITLAYFEQKSTVDYIGAVQGIPVCFDAKECNCDRFSLANIHTHQIDFMNAFENQGGISFLIIHYTHKNIMYYLPFKLLLNFLERADSGGRKSFTIDEVGREYQIQQEGGVYVHYLTSLQKDLASRD